MAAARPLLAALALVAIVAAIVGSGIFSDLSAERLRAAIEGYGPLGPLAFMGLMIAGLFVPGPEFVLVALGGAIFGTGPAFAYCWIAAVVGTAIPFGLVRQAVGRYVNRPDGIRFERLRKVDARLVERGFVTVLALRLVLGLAPPLNWALGATRVRWRDYVAGTALGVTPGLGLGAYLGDSVAAAGSWTALLTPSFVVPALVGAAAFVAGAVVARRVFGAGGA